MNLILICCLLLSSCRDDSKVNCSNNYAIKYNDIVHFDEDERICYDFDEALNCLRDSENSFKGLRVHFININGGDRSFLMNNYFNKMTDTKYFSLKNEYLTVFLILDVSVPLKVPYYAENKDAIFDLMDKNNYLHKKWNSPPLPIVVTTNRKGRIISQESIMIKTSQL